MKHLTFWASDRLNKEIMTVAQVEYNRAPHRWRNQLGQPSISRTLQMLLWMGLEAYKASPKHNLEKWDVAAYMVDHDGLRPEQVRRDEIDSILTAFDSIEKDEQ